MLQEQTSSPTRQLQPLVILEPNPLRKTYFRLRQVKQQMYSPNKLIHRSSPKHYTDFYAHQQTTLDKLKPREIREKKLSSTANNFYNLKKEQRITSINTKQDSPRRTFYNQRSIESPNRPPSSTTALFGRTSLNFGTQNIFKNESNDNYLNKYQIIKELGKGSFSTVFLAKKRQNTRKDSPKKCQAQKMSESLLQMSPEKDQKRQNPQSVDITEQEESIRLNQQQTIQGKPNEEQEMQQAPKLRKEDSFNTDTEQLVAIKVYEKFKMNKDPHKFKNIRKQINIMMNLDNQGVLKLYQNVETLTKINLVVQYGGEQSLLQYVKQNYPLTISKVRDISFQLIKAIAYLHDKNIVHRDIKLQNVLIHHDKIKLIDFGFSCLTHKQQKLTVICGTPNYMAPEVISRKQYIGEQADIWSFGVVVYALAEGRHPFKAETYNQLERLVNRGKFQFKKINDAPFMDFVRRILKLKGSDRPSAKQILESRWFKLTDNSV